MKLIIKISLLAFLLLANVGCSSQDLNLSTKNNKFKFEIGEPIDLKLSLSIDESELLIKPESNSSIVDLNNFEKELSIICNKLGKQEIGPYQVNINGKTLTSNTIYIEIVSPPETDNLSENTKDTIISIDAPIVIEKGEEFVLTLKSNYNLVNSKSIRFAKNRKAKQLGLSTSTSMSIVNGVTTQSYKYIFRLKALKSGKLIINNLSFEPALPAKFKEYVIEVK